MGCTTRALSINPSVHRQGQDTTVKRQMQNYLSPWTRAWTKLLGNVLLFIHTHLDTPCQLWASGLGSSKTFLKKHLILRKAMSLTFNGFSTQPDAKRNPERHQFIFQISQMASKLPSHSRVKNAIPVH